MNEERRIETEEVEGIAPPPKARVADAFDGARAVASTPSAVISGWAQ